MSGLDSVGDVPEKFRAHVLTAVIVGFDPVESDGRERRERRVFKDGELN
jgi:hypothetical protein